MINRGLLDDVHLRLFDRHARDAIVRGRHLLLRLLHSILGAGLLLLEDRRQSAPLREGPAGSGQKDERDVVTQQQGSQRDVGRGPHSQSCHFAVDFLRLVVGTVRRHRPDRRLRRQDHTDAVFIHDPGVHLQDVVLHQSVDLRHQSPSLPVHDS